MTFSKYLDLFEAIDYLYKITNTNCSTTYDSVLT